MYLIYWRGTHEIEHYENKEEWESRIDYLAEYSPYDLDVNENICTVDDGDWK